MQYKYSIIEGEQSTIKEIEKYFEKISDYKCVGVSSCKDQSLDIILEHMPDFVFINVDQIENDFHIAFNFVNELHKYCEELPYFIALSKNTNQAFNCIKSGFLDYILKPVNAFELRKLVARLSLKPKVSLNTLCLKSNRDYRFIEMEEILFLKADNNYTDFFMNDGSKVAAFKTLKFFEDSLPDSFTRIHNSYIVNQKYVSRINFGRSKCSIRQKNISIPFSKSYKDNVTVLEKSLSKKSLLSLN